MKEFRPELHLNRLVFLSAVGALFAMGMDAFGYRSFILTALVFVALAAVGQRIFPIEHERPIARLSLPAVGIVFAAFLYLKPVERNVYAKFLPFIDAGWSEILVGILFVSIVCGIYFWWSAAWHRDTGEV